MWEKALVALVVGILQYLMGRQDQRNAAKAEVYRDLWIRAQEAYDWKSHAAAAPDGGATLRVQPGSTGIQLSRDGPDANGRPPGAPLPGQ